jgi:hypothetical protein
MGKGLRGLVCWLLKDLPLLTLSSSIVVLVSPRYYRGQYFFMNAYLFFNRFSFCYVLLARQWFKFRVCSPDKAMIVLYMIYKTPYSRTEIMRWVCLFITFIRLFRIRMAMVDTHPQSVIELTWIR